jgi:molecular chaperone GrpE
LSPNPSQPGAPQNNPLPMHLMRRRKQQYRLRRRKYLLEEMTSELPPEAPPGPAEEEAVAPSGVTRETILLRDRLRVVEAEAAQLQADLKAVDSLVGDYERRLAENGEAITQKDAFIQEAQHIVEDAKVQVLRARQEMEGQRKRFAREKEDMRKVAAEETMKRLLSPLDHFTLAVEQFKGGGNPQVLVEGMMMVYREMLGSLEQAGLRQILPIGELFDPRVHDAVSTVQESGQPHNGIVQVLRPGYTLHGKVLRPAFVTVNKIPGVESGPPSGFESAMDLNPPTPPTAIEPPTMYPVSDERPDIPPAFSESRSTPLDRARRMLESRFDE